MLNNTEARTPLGTDQGLFGVIKDDVDWALLKERTNLELAEGLLPLGHIFVTDEQIDQMQLVVPHSDSFEVDSSIMEPDFTRCSDPYQLCCDDHSRVVLCDWCGASVAWDERYDLHDGCGWQLSICHACHSRD